MGYPCLPPNGTNSVTALSEYASINSDLTTWLEVSPSNIDAFHSCQPVTHLRNIPKYSILLPHSTQFQPTHVFGIYFELKTRILQPPEHSTGLIYGCSYITVTPTPSVFSTPVIFIVTPHCSVHLFCSLLKKNPMHSSRTKFVLLPLQEQSVSPLYPSLLQ
jgi:hypothetical protein